MNLDRPAKLGLLILLAPYLVWLWMGEDSYVLIHDNLDSEFVYLGSLLSSEDPLGLADSSQVSNVMNGIDRLYFRSGMNFTFLLFSLLAPIYAYIVHHLFVHLVGYLGMYFLLRSEHIRIPEIPSLLIGLAYASLPYYHIQYGISIAGLPLLLLAFLNILREEKKTRSWLIIILYPFFSFMPASLPFVLPFLMGIIIMARREKNLFSFCAAVFLFTVLSMLAEYTLIKGILTDTLLSHRTEMVRYPTGSLIDISYLWTRLKSMIFSTHYHAGVMSSVPVLLTLTLAFLSKKRLDKAGLYSLAALGLITIWILLGPATISSLSSKFSFLKSINLERFYFIVPLCWMILMASLLTQLWAVNRLRYVALGAYALLVLVIARGNKELVNNVKIALYHDLDEPSYKEYFAKDLFDQLKQDIGKHSLDKVQLLNLGIHPAIAQHNGLKTLDAYQNNYPLSFKHEFRQIISQELAKNDSLATYFDNWGSRCYTFSADLGREYMVSKASTARIDGLSLDFTKAKSLGAGYLLSALPLEERGIREVGVYDNPGSYWRLYLYQIE